MLILDSLARADERGGGVLLYCVSPDWRGGSREKASGYKQLKISIWPCPRGKLCLTNSNQPRSPKHLGHCWSSKGDPSEGLHTGGVHRLNCSVGGIDCSQREQRRWSVMVTTSRRSWQLCYGCLFVMAQWWHCCHLCPCRHTSVRAWPCSTWDAMRMRWPRLPRGWRRIPRAFSFWSAWSRPPWSLPCEVSTRGSRGVTCCWGSQRRELQSQRLRRGEPEGKDFQVWLLCWVRSMPRMKPEVTGGTKTVLLLEWDSKINQSGFVQ